MAQTLPAPVAEPALPVVLVPRRWTVEEFDRIPEAVFPMNERLELIDGQIYTKMPQGLPHLTALRYAFAALSSAYGFGFTVSMQVPVALNETTKPEPDLSVLQGRPEDYDMRYPDPLTEIVLVVEVADSSLAIDLGPKLAMYAKGGVPEYWVLDVEGRALHVLREPQGETYDDMELFREGERVTVNGKAIEVASLLPKG